MIVKVNGVATDLNFCREGYNQIEDILNSNGTIENDYCKLWNDNKINLTVKDLQITESFNAIHKTSIGNITLKEEFRDNLVNAIFAFYTHTQRGLIKNENS